MRCTSQKNVLNIPRWGEWQQMTQLPLVNTANCKLGRLRPGPPLQAGPGRGLSCRTGILPDCASFSCKGSPAKKKKNAFQWLSYQASISWDTAASKLAGIARGLLMGCQFGCKTLRLEADGSIWHHSKRRILPNRAYGSRTRPGPAVLKNLGPGPRPGLARDSDPETPA